MKVSDIHCPKCGFNSYSNADPDFELGHPELFGKFQQWAVHLVCANGHGLTAGVRDLKKGLEVTLDEVRP